MATAKSGGATTGPLMFGVTPKVQIEENTRLGKSRGSGETVTGKRLLEIAKRRSQLQAAADEQAALYRERAAWEAMPPSNEAEQKRKEWVDMRLDPRNELHASVEEYNHLPDEAGSAVDTMVAKAKRLRWELSKEGKRKNALEEVRANEEYLAAAFAAGGGTTQQEIRALWDDVKRISANPKDYLTSHELRQIRRKEEGLGLKERGQGICFKMLDQYAMMSPKEKAQIAGIPNVISCTAEGVRAWEARNAEYVAERAREAFEASQEMERARREMQDLRLTCYPMPDWVQARIQEHPQKAKALHLGMRAALPVPFTRDEVIQSVRDVVNGGGGKGGPGQCSAVDPTSVAIAKHVARVLEHWFGCFGWVKVQMREGSRWNEFHLYNAVDALHNDPFSRGFTPRKESYVTPLELGSSFATTFDSEQRLAAAPTWLRVFGRPVFGPLAALAEELAADGEISPQDRAEIEDLMRSGTTWEQLEQRAGVYPTGETMTYERPAMVRRPER